MTIPNMAQIVAELAQSKDRNQEMLDAVMARRGERYAFALRFLEHQLVSSADMLKLIKLYDLSPTTFAIITATIDRADTLNIELAVLHAYDRPTSDYPTFGADTTEFWAEFEPLANELIRVQARLRPFLEA